MRKAYIVSLRGGPNDGDFIELEADEQHPRMIEVQVYLGDGLAKAVYLVERVSGAPLYAQYMRRTAAAPPPQGESR